MRKPNADKPTTLTEAARQSGVVVVQLSRQYSNARYVPYDVRYRSFNGVLETPAEHLQRVAEHDKERIENS